MNKIVAAIALALFIASAVTFLMEPTRQAGHPVIYWKSDPNPQRYEQVEIFNRWLEKEHKELFSKPDTPPVELQLDMGNNQSVIIQAVSGIGADIIDRAPVPVYHEMNIISDIDKYARENGFGLETTYPGLAQDLCSYDGVQAGYPCNVGAANLWLNKDVFAKYDVALPSRELTCDEFERVGRELVAKANRGRERQEVYFCQYLWARAAKYFCLIDARSHGLDQYNETGTLCNLNDPRFIVPLKRIYKWSYEDKIIATASAQASANVEAGYGGSASALFINERYGMIFGGRYMLIRLRESDHPLRLTNIRVPQDGPFDNMIISCRASTLYSGTRYPELAKYFFEYLASREYNDYIIRYADGLPPNPKYALNNPEFLSPSKHPNEGDIHANELNWAMKLGLPLPLSAYCVSTGRDWFGYAYEKYMNDRATAEDALKEAEERINEEIKRTVQENPRLRRSYERNSALQKNINKYKAAGKKIPVNWISNPFYRKYYKFKDMLAPASDADGPGGAK